jgi:hypothetical protein
MSQPYLAMHGIVFKKRVPVSSREMVCNQLEEGDKERLVRLPKMELCLSMIWIWLSCLPTNEYYFSTTHTFR